jgi:hypothetical protein
MLTCFNRPSLGSVPAPLGIASGGTEPLENAARESRQNENKDLFGPGGVLLGLDSSFTAATYLLWGLLLISCSHVELRY